MNSIRVYLGLDTYRNLSSTYILEFFYFYNMIGMSYGFLIYESIKILLNLR
jgi:hypothetical protein